MIIEVRSGALSLEEFCRATELALEEIDGDQWATQTPLRDIWNSLEIVNAQSLADPGYTVDSERVDRLLRRLDELLTS